jgi:electron transfer flavoprotein alpha subunit
VSAEEMIVLIDHKDGRPRKASLEALSAVRELATESGGMAVAVWMGPGVEEAAEELGDHGAAKIYHWDSPDVHRFVTLPQVEALEEVLRLSGSRTLFFVSVNRVKDVAARLAMRVDAGVITDCSGLSLDSDGRVVATKEVFGGQMTTRTRVADSKKQFFGISPNAFTAVKVGGQLADLVPLEVSLSAAARAAGVVAVERQDSSARPDIGEAEIVIAGGRGLGSEKGFELLEELADLLGAAVGASRVATDAGWYPHRHQIGQTGRTISPSLYIGCGISGAIQHRSGMQTSKRIVVINKDPEAPLFQIADFGIVGDLHQVIPRLIDQLKAMVR